VAAYTALFPAVSKALRGSSGQVRSTLQDYATSPYLDFEIQQIKSHQANGLEPWGATVVHITAVDITGNSAKVRDCQDASNAGLADARTHKLVPKSRGTANRNLVADMKLGGDGRWRVADLRLYQTPCHVP
jgi:hypothetical protein